MVKHASRNGTATDGSLVLNPGDLDHPLIKEWLAIKAASDVQAKLAADTQRILAFAAKVTGKSFQSLSDLVTQMMPLRHHRAWCPTALTEEQREKLTALASSDRTVAAIAREVGCKYDHAKAFYRLHRLRLTTKRNVSPRLTEAQKAQLTSLKDARQTIGTTADQVGCSYTQAREFIRATRVTAPSTT